MSRLPTYEGGRVGFQLPLLRTPTAPIPTMSGVSALAGGAAEGTVVLGEAISRSRRERSITDYEARMLESAANAIIEGGRAEAGQEETAFNGAFSDLAESINAEPDPVVRREAQDRLRMAQARARVALRTQIAHNEVVKTDESLDVFGQDMLNRVAAGTLAPTEAEAMFNERVDASVGTVYGRPQAEARKSQFKEGAARSARSVGRGNVVTTVDAASDAWAAARTEEGRAQANTLMQEAIQAALDAGHVDADDAARFKLEYEAAGRSKADAQVASIIQQANDVAPLLDDAQMDALETELQALPDSPARKAALTQMRHLNKIMVDARKGGARLVNAFGAGIWPTDLPQDDASLNAADTQVMSSGMPMWIWGLWLAQKEGSFPTNFLERMDDFFTKRPLQMDIGIKTLQQIDAASPSRATEIAARTDRGAIAYAAISGLSDVTEPQRTERLRRIGMLSNPAADRFLWESNLALGRGGTEEQREKMGNNPNRMAEKIGAALGPDDSVRLDNLFRFHYADRRSMGMDAEVALEEAEDLAIAEYAASKTFLKITTGNSGFVSDMFMIRSNAVVTPVAIDKRAVAAAGWNDVALEAVRKEANKQIRDANYKLDLQGDRYVMDGGKLYLPLVSFGVVGFVTWEPEINMATTVNPMTRPDLYFRLTQMYTDRGEMFTSLDSIRRRGPEDVLDASRIRVIRQEALRIFRNNHGNNDPRNAQEQEHLDDIAENIARRAGWE